MKINIPEVKETNKGWNPYVAGIWLGLLAIVSVYLTTTLLGKSTYLGASTTFVRAAGFLFQTIDPEHVAENIYYAKEKVKLDWQFFVIIGVLIGAFISSKLDKSFKLESVPPVWKKKFGGSVVKRAIFSILGGIVAMIGARLADGCPSGHGLSGMMQLSLSSFFAMAMFFGFGILVANFIYKKL
jgi:uncharacterized membrane protein YedE/YeeE